MIKKICIYLLSAFGSAVLLSQPLPRRGLAALGELINRAEAAITQALDPKVPAAVAKGQNTVPEFKLDEPPSIQTSTSVPEGAATDETAVGGRDAKDDGQAALDIYAAAERPEGAATALPTPATR